MGGVACLFLILLSGGCWPKAWFRDLSKRNVSIHFPPFEGCWKFLMC